MLRSFPMAAALCILATWGSLWVLAGLPVAAKPAKNRSAMVPTAELSPPTARQPTKMIVSPSRRLLTIRRKLCPREPNRVSRESLLASHQTSDASCGEQDFGKAWMSIEWMNGCLNNFTKDYELGFCSKNEGYSCAISPRSDGCLDSR